MGKYMRKAKVTGELALMDASQSSLGVRTRAKTLALNRGVQRSPAPAPPLASASGASYLQLRSRRLELKPPPKLTCGVRNPRLGAAAAAAEKAEEVVEITAAAAEEGGGVVVKENGGNGDMVLGEEASFGENVLELEARERGTRESTPCSLIRNPDDAIRTPGSTNRPTCSAEIIRRMQNSSQRHIPTSNEMDEFFAGAEVEQQKQFIDKYNYDPVSDKPLPGRYEWEKVKS